MEYENEKNPDVEQEEQNNESEEQEGEQPKGDEQPEEQEGDDVEKLKAENAKLQRLLKKKEKKGKSSEDEPSKKQDGLELGEKAYLRAEGIEPEYFDYVVEAMSETGKDIESLLGSKWFQAELAEKRETKKAEEATPSNTGRSSDNARDTVEYWSAKVDAGEAKLSDIKDVQLRRKVVNSKLQKENNKSTFTDNPVAK